MLVKGVEQKTGYLLRRLEDQILEAGQSRDQFCQRRPCLVNLGKAFQATLPGRASTCRTRLSAAPGRTW